MGGHLVATEAISAAWMMRGSLASSPNAFLCRSLRFKSTDLDSLRRNRLRKGSLSSSSDSESSPKKAGESRGVLVTALRFREAAVRLSSADDGYGDALFGRESRGFGDRRGDAEYWLDDGARRPLLLLLWCGVRLGLGRGLVGTTTFSTRICCGAGLSLVFWLLKIPIVNRSDGVARATQVKAGIYPKG